MISNIHNDIVYNIVERLPLKSIIRSKILSIEWRNFINSSYFINKHLKSSPKEPRALLFLNTYFSIYLVHDLDTLTFSPTKLALPPRFRRYGGEVSLIGSCNGLLCVATHPLCTHYLIFNPVQPGSYKVVPNANNVFTKDFFGTVNLFTKFFYDEERDDYKIIMYKWHDDDDDDDEKCDDGLMIYSMNSGSWKSLKNQPKARNHEENIYSLLNNRLHFVSRAHKVIHSFDLHTTDWNVVHLPSVGEGYIVIKTCIFDNRLGVMMSLKSCDRQELWVMNEYGVKESWTKLLSFGRPFHTLFYSERLQQFLLYVPTFGIVWYSEQEEKIKGMIKIKGELKIWEIEMIIGSLVPIGNEIEARSPKRLKTVA